MRAILTGILLFSLPLLADKFHLSSTAVAPAATGDVDVGRDNNGNTTVDLKVEHLANPASLSPARTAYIVWAQSPGAAPDNLGELKVDNDLNGELKGVTAKQNFDLLITAEDDPRTMEPRGPVILRTTVRQQPYCWFAYIRAHRSRRSRRSLRFRAATARERLSRRTLIPATWY